MKRHRPSPALVISTLALFIAMSGLAFAGFKLPAKSVKTKNLANGAVTQPKLANGAVSSSKLAGGFVAPDSAKLGGLAPATYQRACQNGAIKGSLATAPASSATYVDVPGFNCTGGAVQMKQDAPGNYDVKFVGSDAQGVVVTDSHYPDVANYQTLGPGEFHVNFFRSSTEAASDPPYFALIAF